MKIKNQLLTFSLLLLVTIGSLAQLNIPRKLEVFKSTEDSPSAEVKLDKNKTITFLKQTILDKNGKTILEEYFKSKGKKTNWRVIQFPNDSLRIFYSLIPDGRIEYEQIYQVKPSKRELNTTYSYDLLNILEMKTLKLIFYEYYSNGQLKSKMEQRNGKQGLLVGRMNTWNILEYYYPDGKPYTDWGTLKDGEGYYNVLDDNGKVCDVCTENLKKEAEKKEAEKKKN